VLLLLAQQQKPKSLTVDTNRTAYHTTGEQKARGRHRQAQQQVSVAVHNQGSTIQVSIHVYTTVAGKCLLQHSLHNMT
jgi:hypothetical protein